MIESRYEDCQPCAYEQPGILQAQLIYDKLLAVNGLSRALTSNDVEANLNLQAHV